MVSFCTDMHSTAGAVERVKYEHHDDTYYEKIKQYILNEDVMTKDREVSHYEK